MAFDAATNYILIIIPVIILVYIVIIFNGLIRLKNRIEKAWGNIDVLLKQRYDEVPNLVKIVKGYAKHEKTVFKEITEARTMHLRAKSVDNESKASGVYKHGLKSLFAVAEDYPKLIASEQFLRLSHRISEIENMIADRREFYNDSVYNYNVRIESIPDVVVARILKYTKKDLFEAKPNEKKAVKIKFK